MRPALLHGGQNETEILQITEKTMIKAMCGMKFVDNNITKGLTHTLNLTVTVNSRSAGKS